MNKIFFTATILLLFVATSYANPVCNVGREKARADLLKYLNEKYAPRYSTIEILFKSYMDDFNEICKLQASPTSNQVLQLLKDKHYPNFSSILILYAEEMKSYQSLHKQDTTVRAPWDQLRDPAVCDLGHFIVGARYTNVSTQRDIRNRCGIPDNTTAPKYSRDAKGRYKLVEGERWYYEFDNETFIFTFNEKDQLIDKKSRRK